MTNKEAWIKLLINNDTALACIIIGSRKMIKESLDSSDIDFIENKISWLYEKAPDELISLVYNK